MGDGWRSHASREPERTAEVTAIPLQSALAGFVLGFLFTLFCLWIDHHFDLFLRRRLRGPFIDVNAKCPACGNHKGSLEVKMAMRDDNAGEGPFVQHTCEFCKAHWFEEPVVLADKWWKK